MHVAASVRSRVGGTVYGNCSGFGGSGGYLAQQYHAMIRFMCVPGRRKAVWGPKRTGWLLVAMLLGFAPGAMAEGQRQASAQRGTPCRPNSQARRGKLGRELTARAAR